MRTYQLLIISLALLVFSCKGEVQVQEKDYSEAIQYMESQLLGGVIIEGEEPKRFSLQERMEEFKVPGISIAFFEEGEIKWAKAYGHADKEASRAVNVNTLFQAASISKPVAASAALTLVEEGKLELDADVNSYLDGWQVEENKFTENEKASLRRLVSHNAGLTVHGFRGYAKGEDVPTTVQILNGEEPANSPKIYPDTLPGAIYRYSGGGYTVMQKFMEDQTGKKFADLLKERVLDKTGMKNSTYQQPLPQELHAVAAHGYRSNGDKVEGDWHTYPEQAAAGLWTTPSDLAHFAISIQNAYKGSTTEFISPETAKEMLTAQAENHGLGPGLTIHGDTLWFGHGGANEGFRCQLFANVNPFNYQGVAIMTNSDQGSAVAFEMLLALSEYYGWDIVKPRRRKAISLDKEALQKFIGHYVYQEDYQMDIYMGENGHLQMHQIWDDQTIELRPMEELKFFEATTGIYLDFTLSEQGEVSKVESNGFTAKKNE